MADKKFPKSGLPIRKTVDLLPSVFKTEANDKFMSAVVDPLVQPGVLEKLVGYVGRRYDKTYKGSDVYLDTDNTLRSRYQLEPGVVVKSHDKIDSFYDYLDLKNQLKFFGNNEENDSLVMSQENYSWNPPITWDKFVNYREYYWEPSGPPPVGVYGQRASVISSYKVTTSVNSFIFTPDSYTNNPAITLYRGQTYKFIVNAPNDGLVIRTNYDTGSLIYNPVKAYPRGSIVVYADKLWRALVDIQVGDGSTITADSQDWEYVENISTGTALDYDQGVTNNGVRNGTLTFTVPYDSPDILFYQSVVDPNKFGRFLISNIESNTKINVDLEISGKKNYTSSNGIEFTNGLVVEFMGQVTPAKYASDSWLIEGVGDKITLTKFSDLVVPVLTTDVPEILFDNEGFDTAPFDDAAAYPTNKDYITISRNSSDFNPWSRYNRWFHRSVLELAYTYRGQDFPATESSRAKRPIVEFKNNIRLFNHGTVAKATVDYLDDYTDDVFSKIEGSTGYNIDGEDLFEGARILVIADTDSLANNKIYEVQFIVHNGRTQITLVEPADTASILNEGVLVRRGQKNGGLMFHFDGTEWKESQRKTKVNQAPLFDVFDENEISFGDTDTYPVTTFAGSKLLSYKSGNGIVDKELGFSLSYLNIDNVGDIQFSWDWDTDSFYYTIDQKPYSKKISTGFYKIDSQYENGWIKTSNKYLQPIIDSSLITASTNSVNFASIDWTRVTDSTPLEIRLYKNGQQILDTYTRSNGKFTFANTTFVKDDVVSIKIVTDLVPDNGYYEIPVSLEKNPLNQTLSAFTLGQAIDHVVSSLEFNDEFVGNIPGSSNLRDLNDYQVHAKRFLKHSGIAPLSVSLLCDKTSNIIKSIQHAKKSYTDFKNNFLNRATEINYNPNNVDFVDDIIADLTKTKNSASPFSDSDMIGNGAYTSIKYTVEDTGINTFALTEKFDLTTLSRKAVYVYINGSQLINTKEYTFDSTFGFVTISKELSLGDRIEIREYVSTAFNHIPPTPTSMGLYKKYTPLVYVDNTYLTPKKIIQGHDGSRTFAFDDYRDDLLLELELRIYNNIKQEYDESVFDIDTILGGYYGVGVYDKSQLDEIVNQEFLKWIQNTNINYTLNTYFDSENSFTYTYSRMTDPTGTEPLPGWWRGVYQWIYDTDRPQLCPWEMLGFSEKPDWWESEYGPAPYTSNNLLLWEDLRDGIIRQGPKAGTYERYQRPGLLDHIPVDGDGKLLSPLDSNLAQNFALINAQGSFKLGDVGPVEHSWRTSSEWPFAITMALCLMKPFEYITDSFDRSKTKINKLGQTINSVTGLIFEKSDLTVPVPGIELSSGLVKYLVSYLRSRGLEYTAINDKISNLDVMLSSRISGFVDKEQQKYLLDSKSPRSSSSSIFVPPENYDIIFNVSAPISSITYSGVILEKTNDGWIVSGYDDIHPYFTYFEASANQKDALITVGGVSETFVDWAAGKTFNNGQIVRYNNVFYRSLKTHVDQTTFEEANWKKLPKLPMVGAVEAYRRTNFLTFSVRKLSYGEILYTVQEVVDFLLGYESYLISQGFKFDRYDTETRSAQDWLTSCKEFMFWTRHNWASGSLLTLSPGAEKLDISVPVGVADNILDSFYDYKVLRTDGKPLEPQYINVNRQFQNITIETTNTTDGIYYLKLHYVLKEHVTIFDDRTVFNDIIYDKTTGYRQGRIKAQGFRTVEWDGDYTSPGFLFDNVNIDTWQPFTDYKLGDIVAYRSYNWTSLVNQLGTEEFDDSKWTKLDSTPSKQLVANFDYRINQFEDYYDASSEGIGQSQRDLARHAVGYQTRNYLQNLAEDPVTQFQLYTGFIREKGTSNAITKVFDKLSRSSGSSITLNEEWAFRVGRLGGIDQFTEIEVNLQKDKFLINPQPLIISTEIPVGTTDQYYRLLETDFSIEPLPFTVDVNPVSLDSEPTETAGYVKADQVDFSVATKDDIVNLDITQVVENSNIWIAFDKTSWNVYRLNESPTLVITDVSKSSTTVTITLLRRHSIEVDDIVGIRDITNLTGFFKVIAVGIFTIDVEVAADASDPLFDGSTVSNLNLFSQARISSYDTLDQPSAALLKNNSKLWIDNNENNLWEVIEKKKQFTGKDILEYGTTSPLYAGYKVLYVENLKQTISSIPGSGYVMSYVESTDGLSLKQIIAPPSGFENNVIGSFGKAMAVSPDNRWLIVGSPAASAIRSNYQGPFDPNENYLEGDIVLYAGKLWAATKDVTGDGSTIDIASEEWTPATSIAASTSGTAPGYTKQGMITVYEWSNQQWTESISFVSPRPENEENFGCELSIGQNGSEYYLAVSADNALDGRGRVYLYTYNGLNWSHLENNRYTGIYDPLGTAYHSGDIVWYDSNLWMCLDDSTSGDGSTITVDSAGWQKLDPISTHNSLPTNVAIDDDGSTLANFQELQVGIISPTQIAELIKIGDGFGFSLAMNRDGGILAVGAPNADGQYFANYRGMWRPDIEYVEGDVVKYNGTYQKLSQRVGEVDGSTTRSFNEEPVGLPWEEVGDSTSESSGKVFVYQRSEFGVYELKQTISADSLPFINDLDSDATPVATGDQLGWSVDIDSVGTTLIISSPRSDINFQNQGSAYVFQTDGFAGVEYRLKQKLESYELYPNEYFGQNVSISPSADKIAIGAKNSPYALLTRFDSNFGTIFDQGKTSFYDRRGFSGAVYVFEKKAGYYFLTEKLEAELSPFESFGSSIDCTSSVIVVGSPDYVAPASHGATITYEGNKVGITRMFKKDPLVSSWEIIGQQKPVVNISMIKSISLYDNVKNEKIQDLDFIDHSKLKILNEAEQEIKFKTSYDPATYSLGTEEQIVDESTAWAEQYVGQLWWDISTAKWYHYEQGDNAYRIGHWNQLAEGASIDVYEWVESLLLPSEWSALADTNAGIAEGISGQPLHPNDDVYTRVEIINENTGAATGTLYYYWVKNKTIVPSNVVGRRIASSEVSSLISNPAGSGKTFIALLSSNTFLAYNFETVMTSDTASLNVQYRKNKNRTNNVHNEYQLLTEGVADSLPAATIENKWIDSLVGSDVAGNRVPDPRLPAKQKYGLSFRPRQSMFIDRLPALKIVINNVNDVLQKEAFADIIAFDNLNLVDSAPSEILNLYDVAVDTEIDLLAVGTVRLRQAVLRVNILDGEVDTIDIIDSGFGYKVVPPVVISGNGKNAQAVAIIDNQGRVSSITIINRGKKYSSAIATVRPFSVLVNADSQYNNFWAIYAWDEERKVFYRGQSQGYDTTRYWTLVDWWRSGYGITDRIVKEITSVYEEPTISVELGDLIRIREYGAGGWAVFEKISDVGALFSDRFSMVGREKGTIELSSLLYTADKIGIGFDNAQPYDTVSYDIENALELRNILKAVKNDIFIGEYAVEWNKTFFNSIRYAFAEQTYIDWAFKTSFLNATHNVGAFEQKLNYKNDNLSSFQDYINEVKPYRTTVREYVSRYDTVEPVGAAITDFDLPPVYSEAEGKIIPISTTNEEIQSYPWKWWLDNQGYSVTSIQVFNGGAEYTSVPKVLIEGNGTGATAQAYVSNGVVSGIEVLTPGFGYTTAPTITLVGGNSASALQAKAVAVIGDAKARTFDVTLKFDRITKDGVYTSFVQSETFTASGLSSVFDLNYAPTRDKSKIKILKNGQLVLNDEYSISLYQSTTDTYGLLKGKIIFVTIPTAGDIITVEYEKNDELLDAVNRIQKFYSPTAGMKGAEVSQLMTGIDFGGVQIQGTTFDVTGGWDALPWFTDNWDSVEESADYYVVCDGSTNEVVLPYTPGVGQQITVYIRRVGTGTPGDINTIGPDNAPVVVVTEAVANPPTIRIDDPNYTDSWDSSITTNPNAQMPTFVGDGETNIIEIGRYISTNVGDILIFRPIESDGSVTITDSNLLDTKLSGGSLSTFNSTGTRTAPNTIDGIYAIATGKTAEEIVIDGDKFISPDQVPAPEEQIPGQVLDSVSIKVYNNTPSGATPLQSSVIIGDGSTESFDIGLTVMESNSVLVYVDKIKQELGINYTTNFIDNTVNFETAPAAGSIIEIIAIGLGGVVLLDYQEFIADGDTSLFLTAANYADTSTIFVTVDGQAVDVGFTESTGIVDTTNKTLVQFGDKPESNSVVKIICLGSTVDTDSTGIAFVRVNRQRIEFEGSTRSFDLDNFVDLSRSSSVSSMVVELNGTALRGIDTEYYIYDGVNNIFTLGVDPLEPSGAILTSNIKVFINNELKAIIQDYVYDGTSKELTIEPGILTEGDEIKIENNFRAEYSIVGNNIVIDPAVALASPSETENDILTVTWFSEYPSMGIVSDEYTGGKVNYTISQVPLSDSYIWVYKNGTRLTKDQDYFVSLPRSVLYLNDASTDADLIKIVTFGAKIYKFPSAFEIHKDMLNIYHFKRYSAGEVRLASALNYYDTTITVNNGDLLAEPINSRNIPGVISINGERIEYGEKTGNVLSKLRRGSFGTPIGELYPADSKVVDVGPQETIPYNETQDRVDFVSDGSSLLIGPLDFVPAQGTRSSWYRSSIPTGFGPCDQVEVFAAGKRLRKDPITVYDETLGSSSPAADKQVEAEFSVDGASAYIRLTSAIPAGSRISVLKRTGKVWYDRGETTATSGKSLLENSSAIAKFIGQRTTKLPE